MKTDCGEVMRVVVVLKHDYQIAKFLGSTFVK